MPRKNWLPNTPRLIFADAVYEKSEFLARTGMSEEKFSELKIDHDMLVVRLGQATAIHGAEYHRVINKLMDAQRRKKEGR